MSLEDGMNHKFRTKKTSGSNFLRNKNTIFTVMKLKVEALFSYGRLEILIFSKCQIGTANSVKQFRTIANTFSVIFNELN